MDGRSSLRLLPVVAAMACVAALTVGVGLWLVRDAGSSAAFVTVAEDGITLAAGSASGAFYAVQTLLQLLRGENT